ncbi:MAG: heparinase II/III domain-containing protein, partial [Planctomycetota bacterium]
SEEGDSKVIFEKMKSEADATLETEWWKSFPENDVEEAEVWFINMLSQMANVAFVWRVTGDDRYAGVLERALTVARYPKGGRSSPQHSGGEAAEDSTQSSEFLALLYDWLYQDMTAEERADFADSLDWRIDAFVNNFAWRREVDGKRVITDYSLSTHGGSHPFEGFWDTFPAALAAYEDSAAAREAFHLGVNYFVGVSSAHGYEEAWNEGPGYGNSKWSWQVNSLCYLDSVFPEFAAGRNPWIARMGAYMRAVTPPGLKHAPWGHGSNKRSYYENGHRRAYRKLAFLTGDGLFLANWEHYGSVDGGLARPWIECALPLWREKPEKVVAEETVRAHPIDGWVTALSGPPNDAATYEKGVGMAFCCRSRGGYSHSFGSDNSFHIFAYGRDITHGGGTSAYEAYPFSSMSHNTILVDGLGQGGPRLAADRPWYARVIAFGKGNGVAYWCGDATNAYPKKPAEVKHWWGGLGEAYKEIDVSHLKRFHRHVLFVRDKYFVILDDLAAEKPTKWTWLYHVETADEFALDEETGSFDYRMGDVQVRVAHLAGAGEMEVENRRGWDGLVNPITGEDYTEGGDRDVSAEHNVWISNREKRSQ